ncbi:MAG: EthD domain-containing protein [Deltaproteobacteria bacterium]|nr:EthD domain-containing protein [Deltaproteobacteria bacterium]
MIRLVFLLRRKPGMSRADFHAYWRNVHAPLIASFQTALDIKRYVQVHTIDDPMNEAAAAARGGMEPIYDGVAELWWDSEKALAAAMATDGGRAGGAAALDDERRFIDLPNSPLYFTYEYPQVNPTPELVARPTSPLAKLYFPLRQPAPQSLDAAQLYWRTAHGPLIRSMAQGMGILRYQQVHYFASSLEQGMREARGTLTPPYMGHAEVWFQRPLHATPESAEGNRRAIEDEAKFIDFRRSTMFVAKEHVIVDRI